MNGYRGYDKATELRILFHETRAAEERNKLYMTWAKYAQNERQRTGLHPTSAPRSRPRAVFSRAIGVPDPDCQAPAGGCPQNFENPTSYDALVRPHLLHLPSIDENNKILSLKVSQNLYPLNTYVSPPSPRAVSPSPMSVADCLAAPGGSAQKIKS